MRKINLILICAYVLLIGFFIVSGFKWVHFSQSIVEEAEKQLLGQERLSLELASVLYEKGVLLDLQHNREEDLSVNYERDGGMVQIDVEINFLKLSTSSWYPLYVLEKEFLRIREFHEKE